MYDKLQWASSQLIENEAIELAARKTFEHLFARKNASMQFPDCSLGIFESKRTHKAFKCHEKSADVDDVEIIILQ